MVLFFEMSEFFVTERLISPKTKRDTRCTTPGHITQKLVSRFQ